MSNKLPFDENFKFILDTMMSEGFPQIPDVNPDSGKQYDYKFTAYSLKTPLSFKFDNLNHFVSFLQHSNADTSPEKLSLLHKTLLDSGLDAKEFFYVNFYEKSDADENKAL